MSQLKGRNLIVVVMMMMLALIVAACSPAPAQPGAAQEPAAPAGGITVVGEGEAFGQPNEASVTMGVETFAETVAEATSANESNVQAIMDALREIGIEAADIQTSNYSLWAEQRYSENGPEGISGYRVVNQVTVVIRDIDQVGAVIGAVTEAGANSIHGISFSVADPAALEADARAAAVEDARVKAASLAELSGVELGEIVNVTEVVGQPALPYGLGSGGARDEAQTSAPGISPGELSYGVQVQVTFAIR